MTQSGKNKSDMITVMQKLDGSCVGIVHTDDGKIVPVIRAGHCAWSSPREQHVWFARWVATREDRFRAGLARGQRLMGEWLAQAHGIRYNMPHPPFVAFDVMVGPQRMAFEIFVHICEACGVPRAQLVHLGGPVTVEEAMRNVNAAWHGALDEPEGVVYRRESGGRVVDVAKHVRSSFVPGAYLPEISGSAEVWNTVRGVDVREWIMERERAPSTPST